ncbi:chromate transporter [Fistulifera solaris]|uniref:Chromate transporter n=1 Tax=Fistulifera solaris TaxID=1519565 RepID=A0A1Z5K0I7_FISSO|nr:chromate transporter [Fistulifera solaris]|eukprot:GAX19679.1 chromate transporter [Fistulifera solaris]
MTKDMSPQEEKTEEDVDRKNDVEDVELAETEDGSGDKLEESDDKRIHMKVAADAPWKDRMWEVFTTFWPLGFIAFGGPQAHVAILRDHLVVQRDWLDEEQFTELFAIGQGLPGPTSTQLVISTALSRAGPLGGLMALLLWNLPGLVVLTLCGVLIDAYIDPNNPPWYLIGLPPAAISLVFKAFYGFASKLDTLGIILALFSSCVAVLINNDDDIKANSSQWVFPTCLAIGALITWVDSKREKPFSNYGSPSKGWDRDTDETFKRIGIPLWVGAIIFCVYLGVLVLAIVLADVAKIENEYLEIFEIMYRIGSIIFGGGQVVLPMLQDEVVPAWMTNSQFLQGLGIAQSMPGPLFNFSAYLGAVYQGVPGALVAFVGLFGPGVILIFAFCPFWARLRHNQDFKAILKGLNSTAIGLVGAACIILWESAISGSADAIVFSIAFTLAVVFNVQAPLCILVGGIVGALMHPDALDLGQRAYCVDSGFVIPPPENEL